MRTSSLIAAAGLICGSSACDSCYGPITNVVHERTVRRAQPSAQNTDFGPKGPLEWGQLNFLHTVSAYYPFCRVDSRAYFEQSDTHGWLEGHIKEQNYGADWGDFVSFSKHMRHKAGKLGVDLLIIDTGELVKTLKKAVLENKQVTFMMGMA